MGYISLIVGGVIGLAVGFFVGRRIASGIRRSDTDIREKVMSLIRVKGEVTNDDVQKALGVSDATATRYLDALQKSGDIEQVGDTGAGVVYRKK